MRPVPNLPVAITPAQENTQREEKRMELLYQTTVLFLLSERNDLRGERVAIGQPTGSEHHRKQGGVRERLLLSLWIRPTHHLCLWFPGKRAQPHYFGGKTGLSESAKN